jgi:hypothetical protein
MVCRVSVLRHSAKLLLCRVPNPGARQKITVVSYRRLLTTICRASPFAECLALGKEIFVECLHVPRVPLSVNVVITECSILPSAALGKDFFVECPTKKHSVKRRALDKESNSGSEYLLGQSK